MRPALALALAFLLALPVARAQEAGLDAASYGAGAPVLAYNMAVVPLVTRKAPPYDDYTVLEEAQAQKHVTVRETGGGGDVPWLSVHSKDERPLYLLGGEVLLGGQQDRMVVSDTVLEPKERRRVQVVCVEHGRWDGDDLTFRASEAVAHPDLRRLALFGEQGQVWDEVARKSQASGVDSPTGTYRRVLQDAKVRARIARYLDELQAQLPKDGTLTGLALAINGSLEVVDLFDSPLLYRKLERKLLASYVLAALERQPAPKAQQEAVTKKAKSLGKDDVDGFLGFQTQLSTKRRIESTGRVFRYKGKAVHGTYFKSAGNQAEAVK